MRNVVSNPYHLWAHQSQTSARSSGGNESFDGVDAYSYRAVIGTIVSNSRGKRAFYVNTQSYSTTTSKHQCHLRGAIPSGSLVIRFPFYATHCDDPRAIYAYLLNEIGETVAKSKRARKNADSYLESAANQREILAAFLKFHGLRFKLPEGFDDIAERIETARLARVAAEKKAAEAARVKAQADIAAWITGERVSIPYSVREAYLRVSSDGLTVETSRGANVPLDDVQRAIRLVNGRLGSTGTRYAFTDTPIMLGSYRLNSIEDDGTVIVGCHRFSRAEVLRFAALIA